MLRLKSLALAATLTCASWGAAAATVTLVGNSFTVSFDDSLIGLFGTPTLVGDKLQWFPSGAPGFTAQSGSGIVVTNSTFALQFSALPGYTLSSFSLSEAGDSFFFGAAGVSSGVSVSGQLRVTELPGSTQTRSIQADAPFVANSFLDFSTKDWTASAATINLAAGTLKANVSIENILAAYVLGGTGYAFIEKKEVSLGVVTSPIPEPQAYALMLAGLGALGMLSLRRRRQG